MSDQPTIDNQTAAEITTPLAPDTVFPYHDDLSRAEALEAASVLARQLTSEREFLAGRKLSLTELCDGIDLPDSRNQVEKTTDGEWQPTLPPAEPVNQHLKDLQHEALMESRSNMSPAERKLFDYKMQLKDDAAILEKAHEEKLRQQEPHRVAALQFLRELESELKWSPERSKRELVFVQQTIRQWKEGDDSVAEKMLDIVQQNESAREEKIEFEANAKIEGLKNKLARLRKNKSEAKQGKKPPSFDDFYATLSKDSFITKDNAKRAYNARFGANV